jgi:polar amino acid transport system permease protein
MSDGNSPDLPKPPGATMPLPALESLSARIARWPWWAIIIMAGLVIAFYSMFTSDLYRAALLSVTQNPKFSTNRIASVLYEVRQPDGSTSQVSGILVSDNANSVTVATTEEKDITVPRSDFQDFACSVDTKGGPCPLNATVSLVRQSASGILTFETLGFYRLRTNYGEEEISKIGVERDSETRAFKEVRTPKDCQPNQDTPCMITLTLKQDYRDNMISGSLLANNPESVTVQITPPEIATINKADIVKTVNYVPAQCALNNLAACNEGPFLTMWVTLISFVLAIILGLAFGLMRVSGNVVMYNLSTVYVEVIRGIPLLVILLFVGVGVEPWFHDHFKEVSPYFLNTVLAITGVAVLYYLLKRWKYRVTEPAELFQPLGFAVGFGFLAVIFVLILTDRSNVQDSTLRGIQAGIVGLAICYGAYLAELFRAGIQSIGKGQMEASRSLGMTYVQAMRFIILPQAFRVILPPLGNDFIALLKDSSLLAVLGIAELTQMGRLNASVTYQVVPPYLAVAVLYLCMTLFLSLMVRVVERRMSLGR